VANAAEGEPGSAKDAALWQYAPHAIIDGMEIVADLIGAKRLVIWLHDDERATERSIAQALNEREDAGKAIKIEVLNMPSRYTSGENSSVISGVNGEKIAPRFGLDKARPWGVGKPAILAHNSETLARIALVRRFGAKAAQQHLLTVIGQDRRSVREVSSTTTYQDAMPEVSGNPPVLFGGYGATWMSWESIKHLHCDPSLLRAAGLSFGAGIIAALPQQTCPIVETGRVLTWMASQSARQCGPCFQGLADVSLRWNLLAGGKMSAEEYEVLLRHIGLIPGRGGCSHPDGVIRFARSAITLFAEEVDGHLRGLCSSKRTVKFLPIPTEKAAQ
jgi:NADH:ubiquinone oxidoreductase subunit F (NADH-binding)